MGNFFFYHEVKGDRFNFVFTIFLVFCFLFKFFQSFCSLFCVVFSLKFFVGVKFLIFFIKIVVIAFDFCCFFFAVLFPHSFMRLIFVDDGLFSF